MIISYVDNVEYLYVDSNVKPSIAVTKLICWDNKNAHDIGAIFRPEYKALHWTFDFSCRLNFFTYKMLKNFM